MVKTYETAVTKRIGPSQEMERLLCEVSEGGGGTGACLPFVNLEVPSEHKVIESRIAVTSKWLQGHLRAKKSRLPGSTHLSGVVFSFTEAGSAAAQASQAAKDDLELQSSSQVLGPQVCTTI